MFSFKFYLQLVSIIMTGLILCSPINGYANFRISPANPQSTSPKSESWFVYSAAPGDVIEDTVKIENESLEDILVKVSPHDIKVTGNGNFTVKNEGENNTEVGSWITINEASYTVPSRGFIEIPFSLTVPLNIESGEYAGGITAYVIDESLTAVEVLVRQGARIYIAVDDQYSVDSTISELSIIDITDQDYVDSLPINELIGKDTITIEYTVNYEGTVFGELKGILELEFEDGSKASKQIREELIPRTEQVTRYIITDEDYKPGLTNARFVYDITPLNVFSDISNSGVLEDSLSLSADALGITQNAQNPTINRPRSGSEGSQQRSIWIYYLVGGISLVAVSAVAVGLYFVRRHNSRN